MTNKELLNSEFDPYYGRYIFKLDQNIQLVDGFESGLSKVISFFSKIDAKKLDYKYQPDKWSIKDIFQHLIDTERIFMYRCFRISRNDKTQLAGFDQNMYVEPSSASNKTIEALISEFESTRLSSIALLKSLRIKDLKRIGNANGNSMSARAAAFTILGHEIWHMDVIKEKYLPC